MPSIDSFNAKKTLTVNGKDYVYYDLKAAEEGGLKGISRLPNTLKVLLENLLRHEDGVSVTKADIENVAKWLENKGKDSHEIAFRPARVLMQDFTGVPAVVDLAAMRDAMSALGGDVQKINPLNPVDLVIDHSVMVDYFGTEQAFEKNVAREYERNAERYRFLKWGATAFDNFKVVPPGTGICHQVNLEYLGQTVWTGTDDGKAVAYPDTVVGTDSHTTMINGLAVLGWGVGGIEAEAAMLGQPIPMLIPEVVGFELTGLMPEGATATDLVLTVTEMLRKRGVVGKFVEFYGEGLKHMTLEDMATIANMAPEYGATCGFFPISDATVKYLKATGRDDDRVALVEAYAKQQGMWWQVGAPAPEFTDSLSLNLADVQPSLAGPKRPQDRVDLKNVADNFKTAMEGFGKTDELTQRFDVDGQDHDLGHGDVTIAAITSCTNTSNPSVLIAAGLVARKARALGLMPKPWVKTSFAPGSQVVTDYMEGTGLQDDLDALGFNLVGYGCTTCIGNSGPLPEPISKTIHANDMVVSSVLSGNRNFEGRVSQDVRTNYLASPPLVVAYALAGTVQKDISQEALGTDKDGNDVFLKDLWPTNQEIADIQRQAVTSEMFRKRYGQVFKGDEQWQDVKSPSGETYEWQGTSTYVQHPPYFEGMPKVPAGIEDVSGAHILGLFGDSITTDHISPAGAIKATSPAGKYLTDHDVPVSEFNSYGARRGNHEVMMRGTFANIRIRNQMLRDVEGGYTLHVPSGEEMSIYDAAMAYQKAGTPLVVFAGKEYGTGSSRDWAAKGTRLLGVRAVIAESYERIHRSNLVGMGVLPLQMPEGGWKALGLSGRETVAISGLADLKPRMTVPVVITMADGSVKTVETTCRIDTETEMMYYRHGGVLPYVLRNLAGV